MLLVVLLDGVGMELKDLPFMKTLNPEPLETYTFTYPSAYAFLTGKVPKMDWFWRDGRMTKTVFSWRDYDVEFLWDVLECRQLYLNIPFSYPPKKINGIMVSYCLYGLHTYPKYVEFVLKKMGYILDVYVDDPDFLLKSYDCVVMRTRATILLSKDMDLVFTAYTTPDRVLHKRLEIGEDRVENFMYQLDANLHLLFSILKPEYYIVFSDHGFTRDGYHGPGHPSTKWGIVASNLGRIRRIEEVFKKIIDLF